MKTIAERLMFFREKKKMSPSDVAKRLNIETELYLRWENGECEPDTDNLLLLAHLFGTSGNYLLYGRDISGPHSMFPKDAAPSSTPISDWRFLCGVLMMFVGGAGAMMFVMRYMSKGIGFEGLLEIGNIPLAALAGIFALGLAVCILACALNRTKKKKSKRSTVKNEKNKH